MKKSCVPLLKSSVLASALLLAAQRAVADDPDLAAAPFQAEFSSTFGKPALTTSPALPQPFCAETTPAIDTATPPRLRAILSDAAGDFRDRVEAVRALGSDLSVVELAALRAFLKTTPRAGEMNPDGLNWLKNDILNILRDQRVPTPDLTRLLIGIYRDPAQDSVMRDYAIQHLVRWYERGAPDAPEAAGEIRSVLREAVQEPHGIAGTALLGWHRLSREDAAMDLSEIDRQALRLAQSAETCPATRLTAIQVCAERGLRAVLPTIATLVETPDCEPLRLSAQAAVGRLEQLDQGVAAQDAETTDGVVAKVVLETVRWPLE